MAYRPDRRDFVVTTLGALSALAPPAARAQQYPQRPIRLVLPFAAGGNTDIVARIVAEQAGALLKQPMVVENRTGAGGTIGTAAVVTAAPDGHTLLMTTVAHALSASVYPRLPYDPEKDFRPIALLGRNQMLLVTRPQLPVTRLQDLIDLMKAQPGAIKYGHGGEGVAQDAAGRLFRTLAKVDFISVPYRGAGPALADLLAGNIDWVFDAVSTSREYIRSGMVRPIAQTGVTRSPHLPDIPTLAEAGLPGYSAYTWQAILAPRNTPEAVIEKLNAVFNAAIEVPAVAKRFEDMGTEIIHGSTPASTRQYISEELKRWSSVMAQPRKET